LQAGSACSPSDFDAPAAGSAAVAMPGIAAKTAQLANCDFIDKPTSDYKLVFFYGKHQCWHD
jgi:hypothetical protein